MPTVNKIDDSFANCKVFNPIEKRWQNGKYKYHRPDGKAVVEVSTGWAKSRRLFPGENVKLNDNVEVVQK